jgi:dienelactone hydrolase
LLRCILALSVLCAGLSGFCVPNAAAQEVVRFPASRPESAEQGLLRGELVRPQGPGRFPAVVLMHGCGGWQPAVHYALQLHAEHLKQHGYAVLNLDSFGPRHRSGGGLCGSDARLRDALVYRAYDAFDALRYLRAQPFVSRRNIFLMGQSNGGSVAMEVASASELADHGDGPGFRAVVAYYPWCGVFGGGTVRLASPLLILSGGRDDWVSASECRAIRAKDAELAVMVYPGAAHSFDVNIIPQRYFGHLIGYDAGAAADSEERMAAFFDDHLTPDFKRRRMGPLLIADTSDRL